jgi:hypothetical protein
MTSYSAVLALLLGGALPCLHAASTPATTGRFLFHLHCAACHGNRSDLVVQEKARTAAGIQGAINTVDRMADLKRLPVVDLEAIAAYVRGDAGATDVLDFSGLWMVPSEAGWGVSLTHQRGNNRLFAVVYSYDGVGQQWLAVPEGTWSGDNTTFSGRAYVTRGPRGLAAFDSRDVVTSPVGQLSLQFRSETSADLTLITPGSPVLTKQIVKLAF